MADEQHTVRSVSWGEIFGFSHIFKSFKMALHFSKMLLALAAIAITWGLGVFVMDPIWSGASDSNRVQKNEAWELWKARSRAGFLQDKDKWRQLDRVNRLWTMADRYRQFVKLERKQLEEDFGKAFAAVQSGVKAANEEELRQARSSYQSRQTEIEKIEKEDQREAAEDSAKAKLRADEQAALTKCLSANATLNEIRGGRIFSSFLEWQQYCLSNALSSVTHGRFTAGVGLLYRVRGSIIPGSYRVPEMTNQPDFTEAPTNNVENYGLIAWLVLMVWGVWWLFSIYRWYAIIYVAAALATWAFFGGGICRIAALHAAREEKIPLGSALRFSCSKWFSFFMAPLIPVVAIVFLGLVFLGLVGGAVGSIPYFGEWWYALLFPVGLIFGAIIAFLTVGLGAGGPLMWPVIAVEGTDGFDAFSRSYQFTYARPFRYGLYWLVAAIYGTACYLFVRLFAFIILRSIHFWSGWGMGWASRPAYGPGANKLDTMWPPPSFSHFNGPLQWQAMGGSESWAAVVLWLGVCLVSGIVLAFLACFVLSAATNMYLLLRRHIDATDMDYVYVEEEEEELPPLEEPAGPAAEEKPAGETGQQEPPEGEQAQGEETQDQ